MFEKEVVKDRFQVNLNAPIRAVHLIDGLIRPQHVTTNWVDTLRQIEHFWALFEAEECRDRVLRKLNLRNWLIHILDEQAVKGVRNVLDRALVGDALAQTQILVEDQQVFLVETLAELLIELMLQDRALLKLELLAYEHEVFEKGSEAKVVCRRLKHGLKLLGVFAARPYRADLVVADEW
eukprot:CAMPEP_0170450518 /NCGR_PEP_ID=MMETSP0123-20130129/27_1 /TAXON_ID=182087 /ORGANISM="Favella ehrenbergii, Strain Fehren 1" /LENGTH=179 /DNA_ID=CAMNT_0010711825 /DNA_START=1362 /DNA_END=1899 /DNA_ORIENTATION=-